MPKKKEPTGTPVKAGTTKTANKTEPVKTTPAKPVEAPKPATAESAARPAPKSTASAKPTPVKAAEKPASTPATPVKAVEKPASTPATPAKAAEKPAPAPATPAKAAEKPVTASTKAKTTKTSAAETKVPASGKRADSVVTVIVAKYDVGFGNNLYIRGEGADLAWDAGAPMKNVENDVWVWTTNEMTEGVISFKFLINDNPDHWSAGDNLSASAGETTTLSPVF